MAKLIEKGQLIKYLNRMLNVLTPIVKKDKDIILFIKDSQMSKDEQTVTILWFVCACIAATFDKKKKEARILVQKAIENMKASEMFLEKHHFHGAHDILMEEFQDNCEEWFDVLTKSKLFKPFLEGSKVEITEDLLDELLEEAQEGQVEEEEEQEQEEDEDAKPEEVEQSEEVEEFVETYEKKGKKSSKGLPEWLEGGIQVSLNILIGIFVNEEDVTDLIENFKNKETKVSIVQFLAAWLLSYHLKQCVEDKEELPSISLFKKDPKLAFRFFDSMAKHFYEKLTKTIRNFKDLFTDLKEVLSDHYREFIKKMYRKLAEEIEKARNKNK